MKKIVLIIGILAVLGGTFFTSTSCGTNAGAKGADTLKINTTEMGADIIGFNGATPLEISVAKGVITEIKALPNQETPRYFQMVQDSLLTRLVGKTVEEVRSLDLEVDAVSGATYSSQAVIRNLQRALEASPESKQ
jgi:electron transport complex protein RnfG